MTTIDTKIGVVELIQSPGDLPADFSVDRPTLETVGIDTETTGLDWRADTLGLIQVFLPSTRTVYLIRPTRQRPDRLLDMLESNSWTKVFHFALFDLRFLSSRWDCEPRKIRCTKVASKLLQPARESHSLKDLLLNYLQVEIPKSHNVRVSDWTSEKLSVQQSRYAALDTVYLPKLFCALNKELDQKALTSLADETFGFLPHLLRAQLLGVDNLFGY